ncbi:hypothetical protein SMAC4_04948 [Sordaria macrospora]|uniref:uncharacterized protein n=1 Tax=Sordaria macrospora TaxID=5147 RepID=UPI002B2AAD94|nr:hypothetical protein SMAC4_04948 [Sordaria macrospora]
MSEKDPLVLSYSHLHHLPQPSSALHVLKKIASVVKPLMRARGWRVRELGEFYPEQENLLGLNINRGAKILLRLRYPSDKSLFLPVEQVTDTMLHELAHIVHGPHDGKFQALWDQLRDEHEGLVMKGYTGEGFLSEGRRLGGGGGGGGGSSFNRGRIPMHEARRLAREQAEKRKVQTTLSAGSGQKLGGARPRPGQDIRRVIVEAVERRNKTLKGCGVGVKDTGDKGLGEQEIRKIEEQATRNGFRSRAEEDEANEAAIAQALWELVQEDEKKKFGSGYVEPSREFPAGSQGAFQQTQEDLEGKGSATSSLSSKQPPPIPHHTKPAARPTVTSPRSPPPPQISAEREPSNESSSDGWACRICTLHNPDTFLLCDACGTKRLPRTLTSTPTSLPKDNTRGSSSSSSSKPSSSSKSSSLTTKHPSSSVIDLTKSPPSIRTRPSSSSHNSKHNSSHGSSHSSSHGSSSKSKSSSNSNSKSHSHSHSRTTSVSRSASVPGSASASASRSTPVPQPKSSSTSTFQHDPKTDKEKEKEREREKAKKAKSTLQAQAEADAARHKLLTEKWQCSFCGKRMERQWWTCSTCGRMKDSSK